jgi:hypothetical protein
MILNARDKITRCLLSLAKTPLIFYPYYRYHLPLPSVILIENTNCCNAQCVMCPRETLTRKRGFMEFGLFEKIIREVSSASRKPVVHLHGFGEPLLDTLLPERIKLAKTCGIKHTYIVTNASLLFPETARKIINAGLDTMKISFYGTDEESYHATMRRLDFKVALNNIRDFLRIRKELKKRNPKLILQYLPQEANGAKTEEFQSLWRSVLWRREGVQPCGRKDSVCLFLPLGSPVGALRRQGRYLLHGLQWPPGRRRSELPECHGNLEWACVVRDPKELWKVEL